MRPHALRLRAFGAFADEVTLDLDALSSAGLFLLHGPTGAGKTTLLDGIGFALFGRVPGARGAAKRLRSDHAAVTVRTEVCLEATFGGRRVRITRSPAWERPKARGTGTTTEPARVLLEEHRHGAWEVLSSRPREADDEVLDLVGMSAEQFFQVVLLPQGEFAAFLRASSTDRGELLERLFATERFGSVEAWLAGRRRATAEAVAVAEREVADVVARVTEASGVCSVEELAVPALVPWAVGLLGDAVAEVEAAQQSVAAAVAARESCRAAALEAGRLAERQARRRDALARQAALTDGRDARVALQVQLDAATRAASVAPLLAAAAARRAARDEALAVWDRAAAGIDLDALGGGTRDALRDAVAAARQRTGLLEALRDVDADRAAALAEAVAARDEQADALAAVAAAQLELAALPARRSEVDAHLAAARSAELRLPTLRAERSLLVALRPEVVALAELRSEVLVLREEAVGAGETAVSLRSKAADLRIASERSMVARLAAGLRSGEPCLVCGSVEHPSPSSLADEGVSAEAADAAADDAAAAEAVVVSLKERQAARQAVLDEVAERVGERRLPELDEELAALDVELEVVTRLAETAGPTEKQLVELEALRSSLMTAVVAEGARAAEAERRATDATARAAAAAARLAEAGAADLGAALSRAVLDTRALEAAWDASTVLDGCSAALLAAEAEVLAATTEAGFASVEDARAAVRDVAWREETAAVLREAADVEAALAAELGDPALAVDLTVDAPVAETAAALAAADAVHAAAGEVLGSCRSRAEALTRLVPELEGALGVLAPVLEKAREVRALADLCAGGGANALRMSLRSYVLAARLEEVAAAASVRLVRMTGGRYELAHTDGAARGGQRSGLGLLVRDAWTGEERDPATLSGGETFLASLSLALGLADVVTAEAGGARIGALFVDEGFGTLDEDALDEVMDVLDGLREGGRVVGLVSHVAELRQRIPARVEVLKGRSGSSVAVHGC